MQQVEHYTREFASLRVDRIKARYTAATLFKAPHKPLLLLAILDLAGAGLLTDNYIALDNDLAEAFRSYWRAILPESRGSIILPFFHMSSQSFWHLLPKAGQQHTAAAIRQVRSWAQFDAIYAGARLDDDLFACIQLPSARDTLRQTLLLHCFSPDAQIRLQQRSGLNTEAWHYSTYLLNSATGSIADSSTRYKVRPVARQQGFRRSIMQSYNHCCAQCGIRMRTPEGYSIVDAAHIIPWRISRNDAPSNGLALCKLCHWLFDTGLTGITPTYSIVLSPWVMEASNLPRHITQLEGTLMTLPANSDFYPSQSALAWHNNEIFRSKAE